MRDARLTTLVPDALGDVLRPYQVSARDYLAARQGALLCDPPRTGKSLSIIAAAVAVGVRSALILAPSMAAWGWAREWWQWRGVRALVLEGAAATKGRWLCTVCDGTGIECRECRRTGSTPVRVTDEVLTGAQVMIASYGVLAHHQESTSAGKGYERSDLGGWQYRLRKRRPDLVVLDESHLLSTTSSKRWLAVDHILRPIQVVWAATATPIPGFVRHLWPQLQLVSHGAFGTQAAFQTRYCEGHYTDYGWSADGRSPLVDTELRAQLGAWMIKRNRADILPGMPPKSREVVYVDPPRGWDSAPTSDATGLARALTATRALKVPVLVPRVVEDILAGGKCVVLTMHQESAAELAKLLAAKLRGPSMRRVDAKFWCALNTTPRARDAMAQAYSRHPGGGVLISTIDAMREGVSLGGAVAVHYLDLHFSSAALLQSEDRGYLPGTPHALTIVHYIVRRSADEDVRAVVLPKMRTLESTLGDTQAGALSDTHKTKETIDDIWKRHLAGVGTS